MNTLKLKVLEDIIKHLSESQGMDLKGLLDEGKEEEKPSSLGMIGEEEEGKPKGLSIEKVSIMGGKKKNPYDDGGSPEMSEANDEMSDSEMEEMIKKYLKA